MEREPFPADCLIRFRPERLLAAGGFGEVWQAQQLALDRPVAVKVLSAQALGDEVAVARFLDEARITASLNHPHVIRVFDHGASDGVPWIAYELLPGRTLRDAMAAGPLPERIAAAIAVQVVEALEAAHQAGVLR